MRMVIKPIGLLTLLSATLPGAAAPAGSPELVPIPAGTFVMGDHSGLGGEDPKHPSDERPLHTVNISAFSMGRYHVTNDQYCAFLNNAHASGLLTVANGIVRAAGGTDTLFRTKEATKYSRISFAGDSFSVTPYKGSHPVTDVRWSGATAYCNWLSAQKNREQCYDLSTGDCRFTAQGFRLPTEAEWEYAACGGKKDPYPLLPWGDDTAVYGAYANWEQSGDPFEGGAGGVADTPFTTPVGFYDGTVHTKTDVGWPASVATFHTRNGSNGYGLFDMSGNVWQWCNDWYLNPYYAQSPADNPTGPSRALASPMPDGKPYRVMRGGNWFNGRTMYGHGRISNRNPSYFRGPGDPDGPWFHIGFRVVLPGDGGAAVRGGEEARRMTCVEGSFQALPGGRGTVVFRWASGVRPLAIRIMDLRGRVVWTVRLADPGRGVTAWNGGASPAGTLFAAALVTTNGEHHAVFSVNTQ